MANTFTQIYIQIVFAVKGRQNLIQRAYKEELHQYIAGIIRNKKQKLYAINAMPDHIHIFISVKPNIAISDLVRDIKNNSSKFINHKGWVAGKFQWQEGYGAFSYGHSQIDTVVKYIHNQEKHHARRSFKDEYLALLKKFNIEYDERYVFNWVMAGDS
jgi:REP element-mobilizing transposase RayT